MKPRFENKESQAAAEKALETLQKPTFLASAITTGTCLYYMLRTVSTNAVPWLNQYGTDNWTDRFSLLVLVFTLVTCVGAGIVLDFKGIRPLGNAVSEECVALMTNAFNFPVIAKIRVALVACVVVVLLALSLTTSISGSESIAAVGIGAAPAENKALRAGFEQAVKDQKAELSEFDKEFEGAKFEAEDKRQKALEAAKGTTYFARIAEGDYFAMKYQKLIDAANSQYKKDVEAAQKATGAKKAEYQKLSGDLVGSRKDAMLQAETKSTQVAASTRSLIVSLGVWPLIIGIIIMIIRACYTVAKQVERIPKQTGRNGSETAKPVRDSFAEHPIFGRIQQNEGNA